MPNNQSIMTFQVTTHYLPKLALRIESLYEQIGFAAQAAEPMIHHLALLQTIEMLKLIEKPELKSRFLKELMRIEYSLSKSTTVLPEALIQGLHKHIQVLSYLTRHFAEQVFQDPLLQAIRLSQSYMNQEVELDSPPLLFWLEADATVRQQQLDKWLQDMNPIYHTVKLYLAMLRHAAPFESIHITHGFYQRAIVDKKTDYLILLRIKKALAQIPKIQVGHHGLSVRFCDAVTLKELNDVESHFELAICQLS